MAADGSGQRSRGVDRAFHILEYLREQKRPLKPNEIAAGLNAPKSTTYDIINLLLSHNAVEYADAEGRIFLGRRLYFLGQSYLKRFDLTREAERYLDHLAEVTNEMAQLCVVDNGKYVVAMAKEGRHFRITADVGEIVPLPWTASGRLLLSHLDDDALLRAIPAEDFVLPDGRALAVETFLGQVHRARAEGFYACDSVVDTFTRCFAAAVHDEQARCVAALCLVAPREDADRNAGQYRSLLLKSAADLTARLAGRVTAAPGAAGRTV